jgi:hypothetical protein
MHTWRAGASGFEAAQHPGDVKVDKKLIHDHNDLSNPRIAEFIGHLILVSSQAHDISARTRERSPDAQ